MEWFTGDIEHDASDIIDQEDEHVQYFFSSICKCDALMNGFLRDFLDGRYTRESTPSRCSLDDDRCISPEIFLPH